MQPGAGEKGGQEGGRGEGKEAEGPSDVGGKGTYAGGEEEDKEEVTEAPSNKTKTYLTYGCQVTDNEISCRGFGMSELPVIHDLEASLLDMSGETPTNITVTLVFTGVLL